MEVDLVDTDHNYDYDYEYEEDFPSPESESEGDGASSSSSDAADLILFHVRFDPASRFFPRVVDGLALAPAAATAGVIIGVTLWVTACLICVLSRKIFRTRSVELQGEDLATDPLPKSATEISLISMFQRGEWEEGEQGEGDPREHADSVDAGRGTFF